MPLPYSNFQRCHTIAGTRVHTLALCHIQSQSSRSPIQTTTDILRRRTEQCLGAVSCKSECCFPRGWLFSSSTSKKSLSQAPFPAQEKTIYNKKVRLVTPSPLFADDLDTVKIQQQNYEEIVSRVVLKDKQANKLTSRLIRVAVRAGKLLKITKRKRDD